MRTRKLKVNEVRLPNTMSELLTVAIKDAESLDRDVYYPSYSEWHTKWTETAFFHKRVRCSVCLAGAVIAKTYGVKIGKNVTPGDLKVDDETYNKLTALDSMRDGNFQDAARLMGVLMKRSLPWRKLNGVVKCTRFNGWEQFDKHIASLKVARDILQAKGL